MTSDVATVFNPLQNVQDALRILAEGAPSVAQNLVDISNNERAPAVARVQAATAVLDRIGLYPKSIAAPQTQQQQASTEDALDKLRERLESIENNRAVPQITVESPTTIKVESVIDAEILE